jgi:hypothetical protein
MNYISNTAEEEKRLITRAFAIVWLDIVALVTI